ncbi:hypothetical protein HDV00_011988 [Rhizophlyctis rosea]|nr:hypothetical protein HDV00_011988 [Rhizophlyctis rosea]
MSNVPFQTVAGFEGPIRNRGLSATVPLAGTAGCDFTVILTDDKNPVPACYVPNAPGAAQVCLQNPNRCGGFTCWDDGFGCAVMYKATTVTSDVELAASNFTHSYVLGMCHCSVFVCVVFPPLINIRIHLKTAGLTYLDVNNKKSTAVASTPRTESAASAPTATNAPSTPTTFPDNTTPAQNTTPIPKTASQDSQTNNTGIIAGGVVGSLAVIALFAGAVIYMRKRKPASRTPQGHPGNDIPEFNMPSVQKNGGYGV